MFHLQNGRVAMLTAAMFCGCGGSSKANADAATGDAPAVDGNPLSTVSGFVVDETDAPVANANICIIGHPEVQCATSAIDGTYTIDISFLPADIEIAASVTVSGYLGAVTLLDENSGGVIWVDAPVYDNAAATTMFATQGGFTYPTTQDGFIELDIQGETVGSLTGATATLSPASGSIVYADPDGTLDGSNASTTTSGYAFFGNVAPGTYSITATAPGKTCSVLGGEGAVLVGDWAGSGSATTTAVVIEGAMTQRIALICN